MGRLSLVSLPMSLNTAHLEFKLTRPLWLILEGSHSLGLKVQGDTWCPFHPYTLPLSIHMGLRCILHVGGAKSVTTEMTFSRLENVLKRKGRSWDLMASQHSLL